MRIKQGRTREMVIEMCSIAPVDGWPTRAVWVTDSYRSKPVLIGHIAQRKPYKHYPPHCYGTWSATVDTATPKKGTRWWSGFDETRDAVMFLVGLWMGREAAGETGTATSPAVPVKKKEAVSAG